MAAYTQFMSNTILVKMQMLRGGRMSCEHKFEKSYVCDSGTYVGFECVKCNMIVSCNVENPYEVVE